jgi:hypothetical protein
MGFFKKKTSIEDFAMSLVTNSIPRAIVFFREENQHVRQRLNLSEKELADLGAGMALFFLSEHYPENKAASAKMIQRAYKGIRKGLARIGGSGDRAHTWWKAFNDGLLFHEDEERLPVTCRVAWDRTFPDDPYKEHRALQAFGYFLQMEVDTAKKLKLV